MLTYIFVILFIKLTDADLPADFCVGKGSYNAYPGECSKYVICIQEFVYEMTCPDPLHWDAKRNKCDWKMEAGCQIFTTTKTTTTTTTPPPPIFGLCDASKCKLPHCRCASSEVPNNLTATEVPQMVLIGFDDAVQERQMDLYTSLFGNFKNPNGCPINVTFFVSNKDTQYSAVEKLYRRGYEIAVHAQGYVDEWRLTWTSDKIKNVITSQRNKLERETGSNKISGWRNPHNIVTKRMLDVLASNNFLYDSSVSPSKNQRWWPYTMDYATPDYPTNCPIPPCRNESYPGIWEFPFNRWSNNHKDGNKNCPEMNTCAIGDNTENKVYNTFMKNFEEFYNDKRVPFNIYGTVSYFLHPDFEYRQIAFKKFLTDILAKGDVYIVGMQQAIQWMKKPTKTENIKTFQPWAC
ncbi:chitin deacetylase 1-like [Hydractinia symbiolongicarpus]|uniref:chitin deacetylase 1-like n=1 Tax=Hydractinia symbiolongicarpus TaxID=13093 RepID=UPI00254BFC48|nr:chitin deacetylase 1-like [Hydractinia symbiolongicarpus]